MKRKIRFLLFGTLICILLFGVYAASAWTSRAVVQDPLVRMPGTQPGQVALESPNRCLNCHAGYNTSTEPGFNWAGSMMAQSSRDFLFWACLVVAAQDSIWAIGTPNATDICERCHFPKGWLEGRSDPTNASLMTGADYDGVQCDFCHRMYNPFFASSPGNESADLAGYWDEATSLSAIAAQDTYLADAIEAATAEYFNGQPLFANDVPAELGYLENASGQYFVSGAADKRASFVDAEARHRMLYSRYHKSKYFCATCHDVSNPVLANLAFNSTTPGDGTTVLPTEAASAYSFYHVERTFSEFMLSAYGRIEGGIDGIGPYSPAIFETSRPGNKIASCQDCHLRDVDGRAADKNGVPLRPTESVEHPNSGQPLHDMTGGNVWVSTVLASAIPGSPNHDPINEGLLNKGPQLLTLDLAQGQGVDPVSLLAGAERARQQLLLAASITDVVYDGASGNLSFKVQNQTGHKLISGFPEGRRMFVNIKAYSGGSLVYEINPYDPVAGTLKGLTGYSYDQTYLVGPEPLSAAETYVDELVYEMHPSSTLTGEAETFHFALSDGRYKDNRIPPIGFDINNAPTRHAEPVWHGASDLGYFTELEYAGGYDEVAIDIPVPADMVEVNLYYQTTSREYIEFLRDEILGTATDLTLGSPTPSGDPQAYIIQTDPFFAQLKEWGPTIWDLWEHNRQVEGAAPFLMTQATAGGGGGGGGVCDAPIPTLLAADPGQKQVALTWSDEHSGEPAVISYTVYYDQGDKAQKIIELGQVTSYTDTNLTNGQFYCYKVTSTTGLCESGYSNILCATPTGVLLAGASNLESGYYSGKGGNRVFNPATVFTAGDDVVFRVIVVDETGLPLSGATVEITLAGPESVVLLTNQSDAQGLAEVAWKTSRPRGGNPGTTPGDYTASVSNLISSTHNWDGVVISTGVTIQ